MSSAELSYFQQHYDRVRLPHWHGQTGVGLRRGQIGAVHAIASHFTLHSTPALVAMPTGSGKSAVLMISAYLLQAKRVLVITPGRLVRDQFAECFRELGVLRAAGVLEELVQRPSVGLVKTRPACDDDWNQLRKYDVVVATPNCLSPAIDKIQPPPPDLFDLLLIDEAHHSRARTWIELLQAFPAAKRVLVTATPFRRDRRALESPFVYVYPLRQALNDKIFGQVQFIPVLPAEETDHDVALAKAAEKTYRDDREAGLEHHLMVRTDGLARAKALEHLYGNCTTLKLATVHSQQPYARIKDAIAKLKSGALDGVICVNMMGEGFDFPSLKIAAVHAPHRSLAVTLQFIGRFARTNAPNIGAAKFLAIPKDFEIERQRFFDEQAIWTDLVSNLSADKIVTEQQVQEAISSYHKATESAPELDDVTMYSLKPYFHAKVFRVRGDVHLDLLEPLPAPWVVPPGAVWQDLENGTVVFVAHRTASPRWSSHDYFNSIQHHLFVVHYHAETRLLFIHSSLKEDDVHEVLTSRFVVGSARAVPVSQVNKVLLTMADPRFYQIGLANRIQNSNSESYRILAGQSSEQTITPSDAHLFNCGHAFGGDGDRTVGFSSAAKVWSNRRDLIPCFVCWCADLAVRISSDQPVITNSPLDHLEVGQTITEFPDGVIGAIWAAKAYRHPPHVKFTKSDKTWNLSLLDLNLFVDQSSSTSRKLRVRFSYAEKGELVFEESVDYILDESGGVYAPTESDSHPTLLIERSVSDVPLITYLNSNPLVFYFSDFSTVREGELFKGPVSHTQGIEESQYEVLNWSQLKVDIQGEITTDSPGLLSIHGYLATRLPEICDLVFYDHGSGEMADFIGFRQVDGVLFISLYHCKGSAESKPGARVDDYYEVLGQIIKSLMWVGAVVKHLTPKNYRTLSGV